VAKVLNDILTKARQVDELAAEVASASREQSQGIIQINGAVAQMDKITQSNAANAEESAAAAEELNAQASALKGAIAELLEIVGNRHAPVQAAEPKKAQPQSELQKTPQPLVPVMPHRNGNTNGNGKPAFAKNGNHRASEIPLEGDFKDF
jgi:hypothetical protein